MKILFFIFAIVAVSAQSYAAQEEVLFTCVGGKTTEGIIPLYKVESLRNGRWVSSVEAQGDADSVGLMSELVTIAKQSKQANGCVVTVKQKLNDKDRTFNLIYADKDLTLKDTKDSNFSKAPCKIISKGLRAQLESCAIKDREEVKQGALCRSNNVDGTEIHIRIDTNKDVSYAERAVYQVYQGDASKLGTRAVEMTTKLIDNGNECVATITEANETPDKKLRLVIRAKKPFTDLALGHVEVSRISTKNNLGKTEVMTMPDSFKNMKCEFTGELAEKIASCNVDTFESSAEASPKTKKPSSSVNTAQ